MARASTLLDLGRPDEALKVLAQLGDEAGTGQAHCLRCLAYLRLARYDEAAESARQARGVEPSFEWGYRLGAIVAMRCGRLREAIALADDAVRLAPDEELTHHVAAMAHLQAGNLPGARKHSEEMLQLSPSDPLSHQTQGRVLMAQRLLPEAEAEFRQALALDPQSAESMSLLAEITAALGKTVETKDLRLAAVRADPQNAARQQSLLRRGGAATAGALVVGSKLGILKVLLAVNAARFLGVETLQAGESLTILLVVATLLVGFAVTRVRRQRHGRSLPPLVWEGLKPARRNSNLLWLAWPAGIVAVISLIRVAVALLTGAPIGPSSVLLAMAAVILGLCWRLRAGAARRVTLNDVAGAIGAAARHLLERGLVRHVRGTQTHTAWTRAESPIGDDRYPHAALFAALALCCGAAAQAGFGPVGFYAASLGAAMGFGAVFDRADRLRPLVCLRVVRVGSLEPTHRGRLALRAGLRLLLLPLILFEVAFAGRHPHRFLHDRFTGTEHVGLRPEGRLATEGAQAQ